MPGPLSGLRVIDVSIMAAGPWIGSLLGELGAEVIKIEPPAGDGTRWVEPLQRGMGTNYMCLNVNKRGIVLDFKNEADRASALDLVSTADIFLQNLRGGVIERLGLGYEPVSARNPRIVYCSVSGFGETGPLAKEACADFIMQAYSGFARLNGEANEDLEAFRFTGFIDLTTSIVATEGILAALLARESTGRGQKLEVSMLQAALEMQFSRVAEMLGSGEQPRPRGSASPNLAPDRAYAALDGEIFVTVHTSAEWQGFCQAIARPDLAADQTFATNASRVAERESLDAIVAPLIAERPTIWWLRAFERQRVPCALAQNFEQLRHHAQIRDNGMAVELKTPQWGNVVVGGLPWHFARTPGEVLPPPIPGAETAAVLAENRTVRPTSVLREVGAAKAPILQGIRVVEIASGVAGPLAGCRLGDLGADVVKVEAGEGDWMRHCPPLLPDRTAAAFFALNRAKRSVVLGTDKDENTTLLRRLVERADVLITDLDTAALAVLRLEGLDDEVCSLNTRLIVAQISALGRKGPLAGKPGSELCAQAMAGYTRYVGTREKPAVRLGADVASCATGIFTTQAVLAALLARGRDGRGQRIDLSLLNSLVSMKTVHLAAQSDPDTFEGPRVGGAYDPPERGWRTADGSITFAFGGAVGAEGRPGWTQFVDAMGLSRMLDDPRFDKTGRLTTGLGPKARELKAEYEAEFTKHPSAEIVAQVRKFGGFASAYLTHSQLLEEPQVQALDIVRDVPCGRGVARVLDFPVRFSDSRPVVGGDAPDLGQHTEEVARELGLATDLKRASPAA
jgi:crotonobetainyl-CoA:carnitine CoA-transferase CaiB-like acyl-CoA transferase